MGDQSAPPTPNAPPAPDLSSLYGDSGKLVAAPPTTPTTPAPAPVDEGFLHSIATSMGLDPEQVVKTAKAIKTHPVATAKAIGGEAADEVRQSVEHPVETAEQTLAGTRDLITNPDAQETAKTRMAAPGIGNKVLGAEEYLESGVPMFGGNIVKSHEQAATGNYAGATGTAIGTVAPLVTDEAGAGLKKVGEHAAETGRNFVASAKEGIQDAASATAPEGSTEAGFAKLGGKKVGQTAPDVEIRKTGPDWDRVHSAYVDGKKVGSVGYKVDASGRAQIYGSQVDPKLRGQGIGQKMYGSIIDETGTRKDVSRLTSDSTNTTPEANRVWQKIGEKGKAPVEEITHPNGKPGYQIDFEKAALKAEAAADPLEQIHGNTGKKVADAPARNPNAPEVSKGANAFNAEHGRPDIDTSLKKVSEPFAKELADHFEELQHDPTNPEVQKTYKALKSDIDDQWNYATQKMGMKFEPWNKEGQPYANSREMVEDVKNNHHLYFYQGGDMPADHPMAETDAKTGLTYNDKLRAVHDLFGHAAEGHQFGPTGEENAYQVHRQMFSPEAVPALTGETRAQNSWVNYGPHLRGESGEMVSKGEPGYVAPKDRPFAEQKAVMLDPRFTEAEPKSANADTTAKSTNDDNPVLQKMISKYGTSSDAAARKGEGSFILPEGKFLHLPTMHDAAIALNDQEGRYGYSYEHPITDNRVPFIKDTGVVRTRFSNDRAGDTLHISVPPQGVTAEQVQALKDTVRKAMPNGRGNIVLERVDVGSETKNDLTKTKEFATANDVEPMLRQIQAHPEQKESTEWHDVAGKAAATNEAGGIDPRTGKSDTKGVGVEVMPELRQSLDHAPTAEDFKKFYDQHRDIFDKHPELRVGWDNNSAVPGGHEINVGAVGDDAVRVAKKLDQKSAFNIEKGEIVPTGGSGLRTDFPNYPLEDRMRDLKGENPSDIKNFEHLSKDVYDHLEPDERDYLKGNKTLQRNVMAQYHKIAPSVNETTNAMQAGAALGGWWKRYIDVFQNLAGDGEGVAKTIGPSHAEALKQWHAAVSGNKSVEDANNLAWHSYADWLDAGKPTDRKSINDIIKKNAAQPEGSEKKGNAAISDTLDKKGRVISPGLDTNKLYNLVNSPEMKGERPFGGDVFREDTKNPLMGPTVGARKIPSMGATVAGKGNLNRLVIDAHIRDFYGHKNSGGPAAQYIADSAHLRQAAEALGLKGGEGQEQLWGTVLGLKTLLKEGLTPEEAGKKLNADVINKIGKDYAEVIANDPEITRPGGVLDRLKERYGIGRGSAGISGANRQASGSDASEGGPNGSEKTTDTSQLAKTAERIRGQISESKIKKPATEGPDDTSFNFGANVAPTPPKKKSGKFNALDLIRGLDALKKPAPKK